jgi:small conductance mechanosensitive channel
MEKALEYWTVAREQFPFLLNASLNLMSAILIFCLGIIVGRWVQRRIRLSKMGGRHIDATLKPVIASVFFYLIISMTIYAVLIKLGVPATSLIAVFGGAALAIGLALKDTLSNIASGLMLLFLRPLAVGEFVDIGGTSGAVAEVGLFATILKTSEGIFQYVPNSKIWDGRIQNFGRHQMRQFRLDIGVSYESDLRQVQQILLNTLAAAPDRIVEGAPTPPEAFVMAFGDSSVDYNCRVWLQPDNWFHRTSNLRIEIFEALGKANIEIPFPQRVITTKN